MEDIRLINAGSFALAEGMTEAGQQWLAENVCAEPWQYLGNALCVDHRYVEALASGAADDGLEVL